MGLRRRKRAHDVAAHLVLGSAGCNDAKMATHQWRPAGVIHSIDDTGSDVDVMVDALFNDSQETGQILAIDCSIELPSLQMGLRTYQAEGGRMLSVV